MTEKIRICHCLWSDTVGGISRVVKTLAVEQAKTQAVAVLFGKEIGKLANELETKGVSIALLGLNSGFDFSPAKYRKAKRFFRDIDVIHIHAFNYVILWAAVRSGKKVVYTFHSLTHFRRSPTWRDRFNRLALNRWLKKHIHTATTVSGFSNTQLQRQYSSANNLKIISNPHPHLEELNHEVREETRAGLGLGNDDFILLSYGRLVSNKRFGLLIDAVEALGNVKCIIAGEGPQREELEKKIKKTQLNSRIRLLDYSHHIFNLLNASDLCVFPFHAETFGLAAVESMLAGKIPVVLEDGGGMAAIVRPVADGKFVVKDTVGIVNLVAHFHTHREELASVSDKLKEQAQQFSPQRIVEEYLRLYRSVLSA